MRPQRIRRGERGTNSTSRILKGRLQCGHSEYAVENPKEGRKTREKHNSFNAATANTPWRTLRLVRGWLQGLRGFNAATANTPWRTVGDLLAETLDRDA